MSQAVGIVVGADDLVMVINVESESEDRLWWIDRAESGANLCPQSGRPDTRQKKHSSHFGMHGKSIICDLVTSHTILPALVRQEPAWRRFITSSLLISRLFVT